MIDSRLLLLLGSIGGVWFVIISKKILILISDFWLLVGSVEDEVLPSAAEEGEEQGRYAPQLASFWLLIQDKLIQHD